MVVLLGKKKNMCVSDRPTDPNIFYAKKKKKIDKIWIFVSVSHFNNRPVSCLNLFHFLVHLIDVWNQKHCTACQIINKL